MRRAFVYIFGDALFPRANTTAIKRVFNLNEDDAPEWALDLVDYYWPTRKDQR